MGVMVAATDRLSDPVFYIGLGVFGLALYLAAGAFSTKVPLLRLGSDRVIAEVERGTSKLLHMAHELYGRRVRTPEAFEARKAEQAAWVTEARSWLERVSLTDANDLVRGGYSPEPGDTPGFNEEDRNLRRELRWQMQIVRGVRNRYVGRA